MDPYHSLPQLFKQEASHLDVHRCHVLFDLPTPIFPVDVTRLLPVLPLDCSTSLDLAGGTAQVFESALENGRLSLKQGASCFEKLQSLKE